MMKGYFVSLCGVLTLLFVRRGHGTFPGTLPGEVILHFENGTDDTVEGANGANNVNPTFSPSSVSIDILTWIGFTSFGFDRQFCKDHGYATSDTVYDLEADQSDGANGNVFFQVLWLSNEDRFYSTIFHESSVVNGDTNVPTGTVLPQTTNNVTSGSLTCTYVSFGTHVTESTTMFSVFNIQFIVYDPTFYTPDIGGLSQSNSVDGTTHTGKFKISGSPKRVAVGYLLLARNVQTIMTTAEIQAVVGPSAMDVCTGLAKSEHYCCGATATCTTCPPGSFGECCDKMCTNGVISSLPHYSDAQYCACEMHRGGEQCDVAGDSEHFVSKMRHQAKQCEILIMNHFEYKYNHAYNDKLLEAIITTSDANKVRFALDATYVNVTYRTSYTSPLIAVSDTWNDFLFAASVDKPTTHTGTFKIEVVNQLKSSPAIADQNITYSGINANGTCGYMYNIIQKFGSTTDATIALVFFVAGQVGYSTFPTSTMLATTDDGTVAGFLQHTELWSVDGTDMTGIIMAYTFVAKSGTGSIPEGELLALLECYAMRACHSLPVACIHGSAEVTVNGLECVCDEGWLGTNCNYPC